MGLGAIKSWDSSNYLILKSLTGKRHLLVRDNSIKTMTFLKMSILYLIAFPIIWITRS